MNRNCIYDLSDYESSSIEEDLVSRNSSTSCSLSADLTDEADKTTTGTAGGFDTDRAAALIQRTYRRRRHAGNTSNITSVNGNVAVAAVSNHLVDEASPAVRNATLDSADGEDADAPNIIEATDRENTEHTEEGSERSISEATGLLDTKEKEQEEEEKPIEKSHHWKIAAIAGTFIGAMSLGLKALQTDSPVDEDDLVAAVALFKGAGGIAGGAGGGGAGGAAAGGGTSAIAAAGGGGGAGGAAAAATSGGGVGGTAAGGGAANVAQMQQALQTMAVAASQNAANSVAAGAGAAANPAAAAAAAASSGASSTTVVAATVVAVTAAAVTTGVTVSSRESRSAAEAVRYCPGIAEFDVLPGRVDIDFLGMNDTLSFDEAGLMEDLFTEAYHSVMGNCTGEYKRLIVETVVSCNSEDQCCERVNTVFGEVTRCQFNTEVHCVGCWNREPMFLDSTELESLESDPTTDEGLARSLLGIMKHRSQPKMFASSQDFGDAWVRSLQSPESLVMIEAVVDAIASGCKALQVCDPDISAENQISQVRLFDMERQAYFEAINFLTPPTSAPIQQEISLTSLPSSVLVASRTPSSTGPTRSTTGAPTLLQSVSIMEPSSSTSSQITSSPLDLMPSSAPISSPGLTLTPTDISLEAPTFIPVVSPTPVPIAGITPSPSGVSAPFPTKVPTAAPTGVSTTNMSSPPSLMESSIQPVESPFFPSISLTNVPIEDSTLPSIETRIPTESFGPTQEITQAPGENASPISVNLPTALSSSSPFIPQPGLSSFDPVAAPSTNPSDIASLPPGAFPNTTPTTAPITSLLLPPTAAPSLRTTAPRLETESDAPMTESPSTIPEMVPSRNPSMQPPNVLSLVPMDPQSSSPPQGSTAFPSAQGDNPSRNPTNQLTNAPANIFPGFPTIAPTSLSTTGQTREPADPSTAEPTSLPSTFATDQPASPPPPKSSNVPIEVSSSSPVSRPTLSPVLLPTFLPTVSETIPPRGLPSSSPVAYQPTQFPLSSSTYTPTVSPARQATLNPTGNPTILLTMPPTVFPTDTSTESVTEAPTKFPTQGPTTKSIFSSTSDPTLFPTLPPTDQVTKSPTLNPTSGPTSSLTLSPTDQPTLSPTIEPSLPPIVPPTNSPTVAPSLSPTRQPTVAPTADPTAPPTPFPTYQPTGFPTLAPTKRPTSAPTPSPTERPTLSPTEEPTAIPTLLPTVLPTVQPTVSPTIFPTERPTRPPTNKPTAAPTSPPTLPPTSIPSRKPVDYIQCDDTENYVPCRGDDGFVVCLDDRAGIGVPVCLCKPGTGGCLFYMNTFPRDRMKCGYCPKETISCRYSEFSCANRRWNSCQISNKESVCSRKTSFPSKNRYCGNCDGSFN